MGRGDRCCCWHDDGVDVVQRDEHSGSVTVPVDELAFGVFAGEFASFPLPVAPGDVERFVEMLWDLSDDLRAESFEERQASLDCMPYRGRRRPGRSPSV